MLQEVLMEMKRSRTNCELEIYLLIDLCFTPFFFVFGKEERKAKVKAQVIASR